MYRKILVPLDGSSFAEHALPPALALARRCAASIHLVSISTPLTAAYLEGVFVGSADLEAEAVAQRHGYLEATTAKLRERIDVPITCEAICGDVSATLCDLGATGEYDLVVMATHGRGPLGRFCLGSVSDEMIRHATLPLLLVRASDGPVNLQEEPNLGRVVVPLDGTELAEQIVEPAVALAALMPNAEIDLVRSIRPVLPVDVASEGVEIGTEAEHLLRDIGTMQDELESEAKAYLRGVARKLEARGLRVHTHVLVEERPEDAILSEAKEEHAGVIALETHGRGGISRMLHGSVTDKVIRGASVPILVHRPVAALSK